MEKETQVWVLGSDNRKDEKGNPIPLYLKEDGTWTENKDEAVQLDRSVAGLILKVAKTESGQVQAIGLYAVDFEG